MNENMFYEIGIILKDINIIYFKIRYVELTNLSKFLDIILQNRYMKKFEITFTPLNKINISKDLKVSSNIKKLIFINGVDKYKYYDTINLIDFNNINELFKNNKTITKYIFKDVFLKDLTNIKDNDTIKYFYIRSHYYDEDIIYNLFNNKSIKKLKIIKKRYFDYMNELLFYDEFFFNELNNNKTITDLYIKLNFDGEIFPLLSKTLKNNNSLIKFHIHCNYYL
jgi:hypothetical protein